jgi:hypothetical protein
MQSRPDTLLVRQHERVACNLNVCVQAAGDDASHVRLARTVGDGSGGVKATVIDCSHGGIGITSTVFFPKRMLLRAWIVDDGADTPIVFDGIVRVQRTSMISREPRYYLGVAFDPSTPPASIETLLRHASKQGTPTARQGATRAQ